MERSRIENNKIREEKRNELVLQWVEVFRFPKVIPCNGSALLSAKQILFISVY